MRTSLLLIFLLSAGISLGQNVPDRFIHIVFMKDTIFKEMNIPKLDINAYFASVSEAPADCSAACSPLAVTWLSVQGERLNDSTCLITWETSNEANNKGFDVERSLGNSTHFVKVAFVPAAASSDPSLRYRINDANDFMGTSFYRLRQVDLDNKFNYSKVIAVKGYSKEESLGVYPNPAHDQIQLSLLLVKAGRTHLQLFYSDGRVVKEQYQSLNKGNNVLNWNLGALSAGTYFIRVTTPGDKLLWVRFIRE